ncbi:MULTISPECIES: hypothetical protein [unclassified Amycolatopsis]|nr:MULTISPECIES: hypothetical protein [unclassified Amycolatopsis]
MSGERPAAGHGLPVTVVEVDSGRRRGNIPAGELPELAREGK